MEKEKSGSSAYMLKVGMGMSNQLIEYSIEHLIIE